MTHPIRAERRNTISGLFIGLMMAVALSGCAGARKSSEGSPVEPRDGVTGPIAPEGQPEIAGPPAPYGPQPIQPSEAYGPEPIQIRPITLVLGPGWARSFAYIGVLRVLEEAKIPIGAIVSTEVGSLVGASFATSRTINEFEWSMLKLKPEHFSTRGNLLRGLFGGPSDGKELEDALESMFGARELRDAKPPVRVLIESPPGGPALLIGDGAISKILRAAAPVPGWMEAGDWNGKKAFSAGRVRPFPLSEAKSVASGPIVVVDVLDRSKAVAFAPKTPAAVVDYFKRAVALKPGADADLIIRPDLSGIGYDQFDKRTEIVFRGKTAALSQLARIKHLVGMP